MSIDSTLNDCGLISTVGGCSPRARSRARSRILHAQSATAQSADDSLSYKGKTFLSAIAADAITGTVLTFAGLPGLTPLPWWQTLEVFLYAMVACLVVNDAIKVLMIKWRIPAAVA